MLALVNYILEVFSSQMRRVFNMVFNPPDVCLDLIKVRREAGTNNELTAVIFSLVTSLLGIVRGVAVVLDAE